MSEKTEINVMDEWAGMPEFKQDKIEPYKKLVIRFENKEAYEEFAMLMGQKLTEKTKSIWHPYKSHWGGVTKEYVSE